MKRTFLITALILATCIAASARKFVAGGNTFSPLGEYKLELADDPVILKGKELKAFVITYQNTKMEVTIAFDKTKKGMTYYVLSPNLSIKYVCNGQFFGVAMLEDKELESEGYRTSGASLNRSSYFHQKVIARGVSCDLDNAKLIAVYYPMLINDYENVIASR
jgi:hypothetical protein